MGSSVDNRHYQLAPPLCTLLCKTRKKDLVWDKVLTTGQYLDWDKGGKDKTVTQVVLKLFA